MGILDEAIREHLELKRQHGAGDSELKELEDEAFGPPGRPGDEDAASEAPTEFMAQPEVDEAPPTADEEEPVGERAAEQAPTEAPRRREPAPEIADLQEGPPAEEPAVEETPAMEHQAVRPSESDEEEPSAQAEPDETPSGPSTEERQAIADQPTELYDVAGEEFADPTAPAPSEDELVEEEISEPRLGPVDAVIDDDDEVETPAVADEEGDEDDFFDEKRLSDELNQALEAPSEAAEEEAGQPGEEEASDAPAPRGPEEDLLEETPDFLEGTPEDDELWFEQKPPKDFDFDD